MYEQHFIADIPLKALIKKDGNILFVEEMEGRPGLALPGGRLHEGEQPIEGLRREIREEIGVEINVGRLVDCEVFKSASGANHFITVFEATLKDDAELPAPDGKEIKSFHWLTIEEALEGELLDEYRQILQRL